MYIPKAFPTTSFFIGLPSPIFCIIKTNTYNVKNTMTLAIKMYTSWDIKYFALFLKLFKYNCNVPWEKSLTKKLVIIITPQNANSHVERVKIL